MIKISQVVCWTNMTTFLKLYIHNDKYLKDLTYSRLVINEASKPVICLSCLYQFTLPISAGCTYQR